MSSILREGVDAFQITKSILLVSIKLILPWVGELPWYWPLFESSVKNAGVVLALVRGDCGYFRRRIEGALPEVGRCGLENGYKLCDFRPMFGRIFAEEIGDADYWAFGDCDLIYGRGMGEWLRRMVADDVDVACVRKDWTSGPFTLMKNCDRVNSLFERAANWREVARTPAHCGFDELGHNWLLRYRHGGESYDELRRKGNFAGIMWDAKDVRFVHEDVLCEDGRSGARQCRDASRWAAYIQWHRDRGIPFHRSKVILGVQCAKEYYGP